MNLVDSYKRQLQACLDAIQPSQVQACAEILQSAWLERRTTFVCGNGGSASTASHVACDLNKGTAVAGVRSLRVIGLADNTAHLTALANDIGYEFIFSEQLRNWMEPGDVLIGISASGNSPNCVRAFEYARERGAKTIAWVGFDGGRMQELADLSIHLPSHEYGPVEDGHLILNHMVTNLMREWLRSRGQA